ncbi:MAG: hypothetical protein GW794_13945 [Flavobacteriales bacterium]|nr:hypothetical protein [Flavobacteriales bacterium]
MKKIVFILAFMLIGSFAFANENPQTAIINDGFKGIVVINDFNLLTNVRVINSENELVEPDCLDIAWNQSVILSHLTGMNQSTLFHILVRSCWDTQNQQ